MQITKKIIAQYNLGESVQWWNAEGKEIVEDGEYFKIYGDRNLLLAVFKRDSIIALYSTNGRMVMEDDS